MATFVNSAPIGDPPPRIWPSRSTRSFTVLWWSLRSHRPWSRDDRLVAYAFVLGDNLSAEEKNQSSNL
jgi:hypothetical protein